MYAVTLIFTAFPRFLRKAIELLPILVLLHHEMALQLKDWALGQKVWDDLCQKGALYSIEHVENETGISKNDLIDVLKHGLEVKNHRARGCW